MSSGWALITSPRRSSTIRDYGRVGTQASPETNTDATRHVSAAAEHVPCRQEEDGVMIERGQAAQAKLTTLRSADMVSPFPARGLDERVSEAGLVLDPHLTDQIAATIDAGKHVVLIGPPGTGKTT